MMLQQQQRFEILPEQQQRQNCRNSVKLAKFTAIFLPSECFPICNSGNFFNAPWLQ
jgi:hypothetical protein